VGLAGGVALFTALVAWQGLQEIARTLASAGVGLVWVTLFHLVPLAASTLGWWTILAPFDRRPLRTVAAARWIAESINQLLPALHVGGNIVRARLLARSGVPTALAGASVVVDITLHLFAQILFTLLGLGVLLVHVRGSGLERNVVAGVLLSAATASAFYLVQRRGLFGAMAVVLRRILRSVDWSALTARAGEIDAWISRLYGYRRVLAVSEACHVASWMLGAGEIWLALRFLGHPVDVPTALVLESLGEAVRTLAFPVPGALGVQEGGFLLLGRLFGLTPEMSVALSLTKRVRELSLGLPGLLVWQARSTASAVGRRRASGT
jgi:putative membrane protein